jgi:hypothetical protein
MPMAVNLIAGKNFAFFAVSGDDAKIALIQNSNTGRSGCWEVQQGEVWYRLKFSETNSDKEARQAREREAREREARWRSVNVLPAAAQPPALDPAPAAAAAASDSDKEARQAREREARERESIFAI